MILALAAVLAVTAEITADVIRWRRPVRGLMAERCHVGGRVLETFDKGHLDMIGRRAEEGPVATVPDMRAGVPEEPIGMLDPFNGIGDWTGGGIVAVRQAVDLRDVEDRVRLQERDLTLDLATAPIGFRLAEATDEDHDRARLTLAHGCSKLQRLLERHPHREAKPRAIASDHRNTTFMPL